MELPVLKDCMLWAQARHFLMRQESRIYWTNRL